MSLNSDEQLLACVSYLNVVKIFNVALLIKGESEGEAFGEESDEASGELGESDESDEIEEEEEEEDDICDASKEPSEDSDESDNLLGKKRPKLNVNTDQKGLIEKEKRKDFFSDL